MKLIVGLGNPGLLYAWSRHNIGFMVVKALAKEYRIEWKKDKYVSSFTGRGEIEGQQALLAMPLTYMNLSGNAVAGLVRKHACASADILVICDDLDLEFGRLRIRPAGSSGGQRGLQSIIDSLGTNEFNRLRIGIGRPARKDVAEADFVLSGFSRKEKAALKDTIDEAVGCCAAWVGQGAQPAMNQFNKKEKQAQV